MANNRMWIQYNPSGRKLYLGKRMSFGWYTNWNISSEDLNRFFNECEADMIYEGGDQDDFSLVLEDPYIVKSK